MLLRRKLYWITLFLSVLLFLIPVIFAQDHYTREHSESLMHLIEWQPYAPQTFEKALEQEKPIYLVISAPAWCYWCHVYESEDYLFHPSLYPYINEQFIPIFVDSDKRPDLTRKYLEGGWPSTTIFSPDFRRIQGFSGPRDPLGLREYTGEVINYLQDKSFTGFHQILNYEESEPLIPLESHLTQIETIFLNYANEIYDPSFGGFGLGDAPAWREGQKFPRGLTLLFLLEKYEETNNDEHLKKVIFTFENQYTFLHEIDSRYHLYDPVEGGFHRYATKRDWSNPHYEKMLGTQAKLLRAYAKLYEITKDDDVKTAVDGTLNYILEKLYDKKGGFYSSQDAYLEEEYYGLSEEERSAIDPPYIDKTRSIDGNALMISTLLLLPNELKEKRIIDAAEQTLDFIQENMITDEGAAFYYDYDKEAAFLTGQSVANAWILLAFLDGFKELENEQYLKTAEHIASYTLDNLYDWNSGGFFERNSKDTEFYAPNERVELAKPYQENAVYAYSFLRLYTITGNYDYLEAGMKTLGYLLGRNAGLDETYFLIKAAQHARMNNLLDEYTKNINTINTLREEKKETFFVNELLDQQNRGISFADAPQLKSEFANVGFLVLALLALLTGILSFISPCTLPVLTAFFAHNVHAKKGEIFKRTLLFCIGLAIVFSLFGMGATFLGNLLREQRSLLTKIAGSIIILFGMLEIFGKGFSGIHLKWKGSKKTFLGSILFGMVFAIGWSACIGPILASLLLLSATTGTVLKGTILLFIYALGLAIPLIVISLYFDSIKHHTFWKVLQGRIFTLKIFGKSMQFHTTYVIAGIILIIIGILIFQDYLFQLNKFTLQSGYVQKIIVNGEEWLKNLFLK